jgi:hypothetical protein
MTYGIGKPAWTLFNGFCVLTVKDLFRVPCKTKETKKENKGRTPNKKRKSFAIVHFTEKRGAITEIPEFHLHTASCFRFTTTNNEEGDAWSPV